MTSNTNGKRWPETASTEADFITVDTSGPGALAAALLRAHGIPYTEKLPAHERMFVPLSVHEATVKRLTDELEGLRKAKEANEEQARITLEETRAELYETTRQNGEARDLLRKVRAAVGGASEADLLTRIEQLVQCEQRGKPPGSGEKWSAYVWHDGKEHVAAWSADSMRDLLDCLESHLPERERLVDAKQAWCGLIVGSDVLAVPTLNVEIDLMKREVHVKARVTEVLYFKLCKLKPGMAVTAIIGGPPLSGVLSYVTLEQVSGTHGRFTFKASLTSP